LLRLTRAFPALYYAYRWLQSTVTSPGSSRKQNKMWFHWSRPSELWTCYKDVFPAFFFITGLDGHNFFEFNNFRGALIDPTLFESKDEVVGEHNPASTCGDAYLRQDLKNRDCFSQNSYFWMLWISFTISELSIIYIIRFQHSIMKKLKHLSS
jgi:hypothetical protein